MPDGVDRQTERLGSFLRGHASEIAHFNESRERLVFLSQVLNSVVQLDKFD